jgi:CDP-4-dehydro-6-deoxyglucose reductase, E1
MNKLSAGEIKKQILDLTRQYSELMHAENLPGSHDKKVSFLPGQSTLPYAARVFDADEVEAAVGSTLDFWLTLGKEGEAFEASLAEFLGVKRSLVVNSGSSANLLALTALTSHKLPDEKRLKPGDEVITVAAGFPTTVAPIVQNAAVPVFIDANPITGNARVDQLEQAYQAGKTKAVMMAHALGNPFEIASTIDFCRRYNLWLIEDNCDALGCSYSIPNDNPAVLGHEVSSTETHVTKWTGAWGDISTQSFYPPHHLTMGEGGAVNVVRDMRFKVIVESFRDWGRDCWCASGIDNTCNKRFGWQLGELPEGYDHKYIYSHLGYNLKPLDIQAAIGRQQLNKLPSFIQARKDNWQYLRKGLSSLEEFFDYALPTHAMTWNSDGSFQWDNTGCRTECSWFGFKMTVKDNAPFTRTELASHLDEKKIGNRMLFGGNLVRQPAFVQLKKDNPKAFRVAASLDGADRLMKNTLFIGTYPGLSESMLNYEIETINNFCRR